MLSEGKMMAKGSYILVLQLEQTIDALQVGRLGSFHFPSGYYLYVGSAFGSGGLDARLRRHERPHKARFHWHIDYLRACTRLCEVWTVSSAVRLECSWCAALANVAGIGFPAPGFGASDTGCYTHLFYLPRPPRATFLSQIILTDLVADGPVEIQIEVHTFESPA
ncbi:MAG: GIY-YIG nuclease family protein [Oscillochloris sp.]|nr:GIY-YIG nuclease family protein [Oscillochloris sp.]